MLASALLVVSAAACSSSGAADTCDGRRAAACAELSAGSTTTSSPLAGATDASTASLSFPAGVSANHRYLVDQHGKPYLIVGDSPQCLSANLSPSDMEYFFADRQAHAFNAAWVNMLCGSYTAGAPDASTYDGIKPFLDDGDLASVNPAYFARMDTMVDLAARHGITLLLDPLETGSFLDLVKSNGVDKTKAFGEFLGQRYRNSPNIIWMLGNDYQQADWSEYDPYEVALSQGLRAGDPTKLQTIELNPFVSTSYDDPTWPPLLDLASAYTYYPTYDTVLKAYNDTPTQPVFMVEANYEFENNTGGPKTIDETLRRQEYWTMLSGATGQLYGNGYTWPLTNPDWKDHFDTKAVDQLALMVKLFTPLAWQDLVPDQSHTFLIGGAQEYGTTGDVMENTYATAALTPDGTLAMIYAPGDRTLMVDQSKLKPGATARWFDPTDGSLRPAAAPFKTPGRNAAGGHDWVLIFQAPAGS